MSIINNNPTKVKYTVAFLYWLKSETIECQEMLSVKDLFEIYINQVIWNEVPKDSELEASDLILRM